LITLHACNQNLGDVCKAVGPVFQEMS